MQLEIKRQLFHLFFGLVIVFLLKYNILNYYILLLLIIIGLIISLISKKYKIPIIWQFLEVFERKEDLKKFPGKGVIFYLIGSFIVVLLFPKDIAMASIIILALGDSVSHIIGVKYGKLKHPLTNKKFLEGSLAGLIAAFIGAYFFVSLLEAFFASLFAMIAESIDIKIGLEKVDDNIIMPLVAALVIFLIRVFGF